MGLAETSADRQEWISDQLAETISSLQRCFEVLKYPYRLDRAAEYGKRGNSLMRPLGVAAFAVSGYSSAEGRTCKPYEADYPDKGLKFFSEKVQGFVHDKSGAKIATLFGKWDESMYYVMGDISEKSKNYDPMSEAVLLWPVADPPEKLTRMGSAPSSERFLPSYGASRSFGLFFLLVLGFFYFPTDVGATPTPAPWSSPSTSQVSSTSTILWYAGVIATIAGATIAFVGLGFGVYKYFHRREDSLRSVVEELTRPCRESAKGLIVRVGNVKVGDASLNQLFLNSIPGTSPEASPRSSTESSLV